MKKLILISAIIIFSGLSTATIATYTGETVKQGPEADYMVGVASDQELNIELEVEQVEGLNISYNQSFVFRPNESDKVVQRNGEEYSLREIYIRVESVDVSQKNYNIPVTLRAYNDQDSEGTRPQVIHERDYGFRFVTDFSQDFGLDGGLISGEEDDQVDQDEQDKPDETLNLSEDEENTLTNQNQTDPQGEENDSGPGRTTFLLIGGIVVLTLYIIREAFT